MPPHIGLAFRRFRDASMRAAPMDAGAMFPDKARQKICSVNFRPFSAYKERSEFERVPCRLNFFNSNPVLPTLILPFQFQF